MEIHSRYFTFRYVHFFSIPPIARRYLRTGLHPLTPKLKHLYNETCDRRLLLWFATAHRLSEFKQAPRVWGVRRSRIAFVKALKEKGFDRVGRRIPDPGQTETIPDPNDDLRGSLTIMLRSECLTAGFGEVQKDLSKLLGRLLWILKNEREGEGKEMYRREKSK